MEDPPPAHIVVTIHFVWCQENGSGRRIKMVTRDSEENLDFHIFKWRNRRRMSTLGQSVFWFIFCASWNVKIYLKVRPATSVIKIFCTEHKFQCSTEFNEGSKSLSWKTREAALCGDCGEEEKLKTVWRENLKTLMREKCATLQAKTLLLKMSKKHQLPCFHIRPCHHGTERCLGWAKDSPGSPTYPSLWNWSFRFNII